MINKELNVIFQRTSCRSFDTTKEISQEALSIIMSAGQAAPSAKNRQPYFFVAIINKTCRERIYHAAEKGRKKQFAHLSKEELASKSIGNIGSNDQTIFEASAAILVFRDSDNNYFEAMEQSENLNIKEEQGVANAAYSMMLQAEHMGFSTAWICSPLYIQNEIRNILSEYGVNYEAHWKPRVIIPIGYCKNKSEKNPREDLSQKSVMVI